MDFRLSDEQEMFRRSVQGIARRHLADGALARAHEPSFPFDVARLFAENGLMGITIAEADGGQGGTLMDAVLAIEQVALVCPRSADVIQAGNFGPIRTFAEYATAEQKARFLGKLLAGEAVVALAMSEPDAGSAVTDLTTAATPDGAGFRVNGAKVFTTHSPDADVFLVYLRYGPGIEGIGSVLIERGMDGFTLGERSAYMNDEEWCALYFDNVYVPPENVLLGPGGFRKQIAGFNAERIGNTARSLALGQPHQFSRHRARGGAPRGRIATVTRGSAPTAAGDRCGLHETSAVPAAHARARGIYRRRLGVPGIGARDRERAYVRRARRRNARSLRRGASAS